MAGVKKSQLYRVITRAENAQLAELRLNYEVRRERAFQKVIEENGLEKPLKTIYANLLENKKLAQSVVDIMPLTYCDVKTASYSDYESTYEEWKKVQLSNHWGSGIESINEIEHDYKSERGLVQGEFAKVEAMVKQSTSAKKAMALLEEIGFDLSSIEPEVKYELTTTNIKKDLLGLGGSK